MRTLNGGGGILHLQIMPEEVETKISFPFGDLKTMNTHWILLNFVLSLSHAPLAPCTVSLVISVEN